MKFSQIAVTLLGIANLCIAHPERLTAESAKHEKVSRSSNKCARQIEARKTAFMAKRAASLRKRQIQDGLLPHRRGGLYSRSDELQYTTIQNDTCVLAPDVVWGPYAVDGEIYRHDVRETQDGLNMYLDIGVIDVETCEPLPDAYLTIWHCNATGSYSSFTGIDPNTAEVLSGYTQKADGTTDEDTFLRGIMKTDDDGMAEFLTIFPGYYISRTTHIHLTVQTNVTNSSSYSQAAVQHIGQLFFEETLINDVYQLSPYKAHLSTLNRTTNTDDRLFASANSDGYSSVISISYLGANITDGLVGYITVGVNSSASGLTTTGQSINEVGFIPTVTVAQSVRAAATAVDIADGYSN